MDICLLTFVRCDGRSPTGIRAMLLRVFSALRLFCVTEKTARGTNKAPRLETTRPLNISPRLLMTRGWRSAYFKSNRSSFMTLVQAATKSLANRGFASSDAYTSANARSWEFEPNTRSTAVAVCITLPVSR